MPGTQLVQSGNSVPFFIFSEDVLHEIFHSNSMTILFVI